MSVKGIGIGILLLWELELISTACATNKRALTDGEVMSGGVDMSPKISNWLMF